jgi:hypothetical protein
MNTKKSLIIVDDGKMPHIAIWARDAKMKITVIVSSLFIMLTLRVGPAGLKHSERKHRV